MIQNKVGRRYHNIIVEERADDVDGKVMWKCKCDCGRFFIKDDRHIGLFLLPERSKDYGYLRRRY